MPSDDQVSEIETVEQLLAAFSDLEAQLQDVRDGLTHSHRLATLGTIASIIAHEYNNILTPIISFSQLALANTDDHEFLVKAVKRSLSGAERAAKISSSLLGFARETDEEHAAPLRKTVDEAIGCLGRAPQKDGIELTIDLPDVQVAMTPISLQQVFVNLVLNARKVMRQSGGKLSICGKLEGRYVKIAIADTGPGIAAGIIDRIFEPFVTRNVGGDDLLPSSDETGLSNAATSAPAMLDHSGETKGTGLGLSICHDLISAAGGTITVESVLGQGATFHLSIPKAEPIFETT
jgi:signal transduction histidine kinase